MRANGKSKLFEKYLLHLLTMNSNDQIECGLVSLYFARKYLFY